MTKYHILIEVPVNHIQFSPEKLDKDGLRPLWRLGKRPDLMITNTTREENNRRNMLIETVMDHYFVGQKRSKYLT